MTLVAAGAATIAWRADAFWVERHAAGMRCISNPHAFSLDTFARLSLGLSAIVGALFFRPWLGRSVERHPPTLGGTARYLFAILLALGCGEWLLRRPKPPGPPQPVDYYPTHLPDDRLAWRLGPKTVHSFHSNGADFTYAVNAEGNRDRGIDAIPNHARPTIVVGGESIGMGTGLPYEQGFGSLIEQDTGVQVVNLAVDAYGMDQAYMRESDVLPTYQYPLAVVNTFVVEEAARAEYEWRPRLRVDNQGMLKLIPPTPKAIQDIRLRQLLRDLYHGDAEVADLRAIAKATAELAKSRGAFPLFVTMNFLEPCLDVHGQAPWLIRTIFDDQNLSRVNVLMRASERQSDDPHPGPVAHRHIADAVEKALKDAHILDATN